MRGHDILLIKTRGELSRLYGLADLAVVGRERNIFEPACLGKPVLYFGDREAWENNGQALAALEKEKGAMPFTRDGLQAVLSDSSSASVMGASALRAYEQSKEQWVPEMRNAVVDFLLPFVLFRAMHGREDLFPTEPGPKNVAVPAMIENAA